MSRSRYLLMVVLAIVFPILGAAQAPANEIGVWVSASQLDDTDLSDPEFDLVASLEFDENIGYGLTFTRYWGKQLAVELGAKKLSADANLYFSDPAVDIVLDGGELDLTVYDATLQWHFARQSRISPYVGGGVAYVSGELEGGDYEDEDGNPVDHINFDNELTWLANAGLNFSLTPAVSLGVDAKYIAYEPKAEDDPAEDTLDVNPLVFSAGVRFRF